MLHIAQFVRGWLNPHSLDPNLLLITKFINYLLCRYTCVLGLSLSLCEVQWLVFSSAG